MPPTETEIDIRRCTQCDQTDDHPQVLVNPGRPNEARYHYDCLPVALRAHPDVAKAAALAEGGTRGAKLRAALTRGK